MGRRVDDCGIEVGLGRLEDGTGGEDKLEGAILGMVVGSFVPALGKLLEGAGKFVAALPTIYMGPPVTGKTEGRRVAAI